MVGELLAPLLLKRFSRDEFDYYQNLRNGVDECILYSLSWLKTHEAYDLSKVPEEDFHSAFRYTRLHDKLNELIELNRSRGLAPITRFYKTGHRLAYMELNKPIMFQENDRLALEYLTDYVGDLIVDLNKDACIGIREILLTGFLAGHSISKISGKLLNLPNTSVTTNAPIDMRCMMISNTEYGRSVNTGLLQGFSNEGVNTVNIVTAGDDHVCDDCLNIEENNPYTIYEAMNILPVHPNCYMPDTEVYTNHGWKHFYDLRNTDKILSLNPENNTTEFLDYVQIVSHKNNVGYMYHIHNNWFDTCVTPDHDCFVQQRKMVNGERKLVPEFRKPYELNSESRFLRVINNNNISPEYVDVNGLKFKSEDYAFFMAWYLSEGSVLHDEKTAKRKQYPVKITQIKKDTRKILQGELTRICDYLNIKIYIGKEYFEIHSKKLYDYLKPLGYSYEKYLPNELYSLSKEDLNIFLKNYVNGDGHKRVTEIDSYNSCENNIFTSSYKLVNGLSYIILLAGFYPSISLHSNAGKTVEHKNGTYTQNYDIYNLALNRTSHAFYESCTVEKIEYTGNVYCVELPKYHTLWTKRNGKTSWNGNCRCSYTVSVGDIDPSMSNNFIVNLTNNE